MKKDAPCYVSSQKSTGDPYSQSLSNLEDNLKYVNVDFQKIKQPFDLYPNPYKDEFQIEFNIYKPSKIEIEINNLLGMRVYEFFYNKLPKGNYRHVIHSNEFSKPSNISILKIKIDDNSFYYKIVER